MTSIEEKHNRPSKLYIDSYNHILSNIDLYLNKVNGKRFLIIDDGCKIEIDKNISSKEQLLLYFKNSPFKNKIFMWLNKKAFDLAYNH